MVPALLLIAAVLLVGSPFVVNGAPYEASMGIVSKIFYFHVPFAAVMLTSTFVSGIASAVYLIRRKPMADYVALAAGELVTVFGIFVLISGPLWARKAWGVWWVWEPRLTMTLAMWMIFAAYRILRRFGGPGTDVLGAVVAIFRVLVGQHVAWHAPADERGPDASGVDARPADVVHGGHPCAVRRTCDGPCAR
jgi:heme exporter protein C